jgi:23S rRNA pseudouridine1911/1915/1917 synthase
MITSNTHQLQVSKKQSRLRLDKFIAVNLAEISRSMVKKIIESDNVLRGGEVINSCSATIREGDVITVNIPAPVESQMLPADIPLKIIYEDAEFLVIDKPAGLTVHPGAGNHDDTMANALLAHCGESLSGIGGVMRPGIVHRIDKDTSGLIMAAKTDRAHISLSEQIASRSLKRTYLAICWGVPKPLSGRIEANIGRSLKDRKKMAVVEHGGKIAATNYTVLEVLGDGVASIVECRLETGRTHQIRVHMTHIAHPLIGDQAYCGRRSGTVRNLPEEAQGFFVNFKRQALHSHKITLIHPVTNQEMDFESALPEDMAGLVEILQ